MTRQELRRALAQSLVVGFAGPRADAATLDLFGAQGLGGAILFARNIQDYRQVWELNRDLRQAAREAGQPPLWVMVDQEGGSVARLKAPFTHGPDLAELGGATPEALAAHGAALGRELVAAGFAWDLAPVVDVHGLPDGVMARRSLGGDPRRVAELATAFIAGLQGAGCLACAKHFPGLGRTTLDTHRERPRVPLTAEELETMELVPFRAVAAAGVAGVMVCHAVYPAYDPERPASLSPLVIQGQLRGRLGYDGLVLSDDLEMGALGYDLGPAEAAVAAYAAGCDLLLICSRPDAALEALERLVDLAVAGRLDPADIARRETRILAAKSRLDQAPPPLMALAEILEKKA